MRPCAFSSTSKHSGALMSSRLMPPKVGSSATMMSTSLSTFGLGDLDVEHVDAGEFLEQDRLALHHRLAGERADRAEAEHRGAVGERRRRDCWRAVRLAASCGSATIASQANGDAGRIGERQIALVGERLGRARSRACPAAARDENAGRRI